MSSDPDTPDPPAGSSLEAPSSFLSTVEGEISFFRSIMRARPIGINRNFHVLSMRTHIYKDTGRWVAVEAIWDKLRSCYELDALEGIDLEIDAFDYSSSSKSTPTPIKSPSPDENLAAHPFFREEFSFPLGEPSFDAIVSARRMRNTPSPVSSRASSPASTRAGLSTAKTSSRRRGTDRPDSHTGAGSNKRKRGAGSSRSKAHSAGLVGGDSDSSALTQESGDEGGGMAGSIVTVTDGDGDGERETVDGSEIDGGERDQSPDTQTTKAGRVRKSTKRAQASAQSQTQSGRIKVPSTREKEASGSRAAKKRKR